MFLDFFNTPAAIGRVPLYADEAVTADFKTSQFPAMCAANYLKFTQDEADSLAGNLSKQQSQKLFPCGEMLAISVSA